MKRLITFLFVGFFAVAAQAQERVLPDNRQDIQLSFAPVVKATAPAVVNIYTKRKVVDQGLSPFMQDPFFQQFFGREFGMSGMPRERVVSSLGSGVIVAADGTMVTNYHVIKDAQDIRAVLSDKREFAAKIILRDEQSDLAILKLDAEGETLPYLRLHDSDALQVGDLTLAIGNPFGVGQTVTSGIISALARSGVQGNDFSFFIQTDAAINPGNSGGALVDMQGRLIGVPTAIYTRSGGSNGVGFAVPSNMVQALLEGEKRNGRIVKPWLGASYQPVTRNLADSLGMKTPRGVLVSEVFKDGPAEDAGMKPGDVIVAFDGKPVDDVQALRFRTAIAEIDAPTAVSVIRKSQPQELSVRLSLPPEIPARDETVLQGSHPLRGSKVANLNPALAMELNLSASLRGVVITESNSRNFLAGDIIEEVNGVDMDSVDQLQGVLLQPLQHWGIRLQRGSQIINITATR